MTRSRNNKFQSNRWNHRKETNSSRILRIPAIFIITIRRCPLVPRSPPKHNNSADDILTSDLLTIPPAAVAADAAAVVRYARPYALGHALRLASLQASPSCGAAAVQHPISPRPRPPPLTPQSRVHMMVYHATYSLAVSFLDVTGAHGQATTMRLLTD